jgi:hypothetical protein
MKISRALFAVALFLSASISIYSQAVNATLLGTVTDTTGAAVANAQVTATQTSTGAVRTGQTNASGNYVFADVTPGQYSVAAELTGFKKTSRPQINVDVNTSTRVDLQLEIGNMSQTVEVTAAPPLLQTDRADTGSKIETRQLADLPAGGNRNFQSLLNLVPGTTRATFQHSQFFNATSSLQTQVNGQLRMGNNYQIEGIDDNERTGLLQIIVPPIEAIQTVDVSTSNFEAELGRASGAVTNVLLKSGSNGIHGSAYEFLRNSEFNARNFFQPSVGHLTYNYFGGNVGGPIIKNKLFFFGDVLEVKDHEAAGTLETIPTATQIGGNLSASTTTIYNPFTGNPDGTGRVAFAGNRIPTNLINPISTRLLSFLPAPNVNSPTGVNNYFATLPYHKDTLSFDVKGDYVATDKDRLSVRLSYAKPEIFQAPIFGIAGGNANGAFQGTGIQRTWSGGINYNRVFSPSLIMEARAGVAYYHNDATPFGYGQNSTTDLGIPGVNINQFTSGFVGINIGSFYTNPLFGFSASLPWNRAEANIDVANTVTKIFGNHTIKIGGDFRRIRDALLQDQTFSPRGIYTFADGQTALRTPTGGTSPTSFYNNFASFLLDVPNQAGRDLNTYFPSYRAWQLFLFAQDKWTVSPKLTLDLGLRWEFYPPAVPEHAGGFSNYNPTNNTLVIAGIGGNPSNLGMQTRYKYFAPRFGLAYRASESTVIRAGFGISYTPFPDNNYAYNFPVRSNTVFNPAITPYGPAVLPGGQVATFQTGFPPIVNPAIPSNGIITNAPNQTFDTVALNFKNPYVESYNLAIQQALPLKLTLDVAYVGNHGVDSVVSYNLNAATVAGLGNAGRPEFGFNGRTADTNLRFAGYSTMYNALQVKLDRRFGTGLHMTTAFTWGKGQGFQDSDDGGLRFYINQQRNWARNNFDRKYTFVQSYNYELPFGPGKKFLRSGFLGNVFGNWQINGILTVMSGSPLLLTASGTSLNAPGNTQTPNQVAPVNFPKGIGAGNDWFSRASFTTPTGNGVFGNLGRNAFDGPGLFNLDASLFKSISFRERFKLELRLEAFSATNTPQFNNPGTDLTSGNFGYVTGAGDTTKGGGERGLQLGAKFNF